MDENIIIPETPRPKKKASLKKVLLILFCAAAVLCIAAYVTYLVSADLRSYRSAMRLLENEDYQEAKAAFTELGDYRDSPEKLLEAKYGIAQDILLEYDYHGAIDAFSEIKDYKNSAKKIQLCYYKLAGRAIRPLDGSEKDWLTAIEYYTLCGEYKDAPKMIDRCIYNYGHELFLEGKYDEADSCFAQLDEIGDFGYRHFRTLNDAQDYFDKCAEALEERISIYLGEVPDNFPELAEDILYTYVPSRGYHYIEYSPDSKLLDFSVEYRAGERILYAHKNDRLDILIPEEIKTYETAKAVVEQAKGEAASEFELERRLHDWLCDNIEYETPDLENDKMIPDIGYRQHSSIGGLLDGKANCQGYSDSFELLATLAGFEVRTVGGMSDDAPHAWNMIKLDGKWYFTDITFDDPDGAYPGTDYYIWFNVPYVIDSHVPDIDLTAMYDFAAEEDPEYCYYDIYSLSFATAGEIAEYAVAKHSEHVSTVGVRAKDITLSENTINNEIERVLRRYGYTYANWSTSAIHYNGNTYVNIWWK